MRKSNSMCGGPIAVNNYIDILIDKGYKVAPEQMEDLKAKGMVNEPLRLICWNANGFKW